MSFAESPFIIFIILLLFSHLIYLGFFRNLKPIMTSGSIVMALDVFALLCLPQLAFPAQFMIVVALELTIVWIYISIGIMQASLRDEMVMGHLSDKLAVGYWASGTALTAVLLDHAEQTLHGFIVLFSIISIVLYFFYLLIMLRWLLLCIRKKFQIPVDGEIVLTTVSTQSVVLLLVELFTNDIPVLGYQIVIIFGLVLYAASLLTIFRHAIKAHVRHLVAGWPNANSMGHGAISITGLAMVESQAFSLGVISVMWWWSLIFFFIMEAVEFVRLIIRIKMKGLRKGVFVYSSSQWSRIFSFGILYGFAFSYYNLSSSSTFLTAVIAENGQYVVAALLIIQLVVTLSYVLKRENKK